MALCAAEHASIELYFLNTETYYNFLMKKVECLDIYLKEWRIKSQDYLHLIKIQHEKVNFPSNSYNTNDWIHMGC